MFGAILYKCIGGNSFAWVLHPLNVLYSSPKTDDLQCTGL